MEKIEKSVVIAASPQAVFDYLTDARSLVEIWPSMVEVSNVQISPEGGHDFDWIYKMAGVRFRGHSHTTQVDRNRVRVVKNDGIPSTFRWEFIQRDDGGMQLKLQVEYEIPASPVLAKLARPLLRRINEREADMLVANLKDRMEAQLQAAAQTEGPTASPPSA